ncbi:hypothetical protein SAMN05720606_101114 [Paenibacillus polysaccharolyticus]|uniref:Uncharacterized protein n=1 Tax=Paenibacillus polysaccharolyticus TaxID=582692 RepID=A0A1G5AV22_9BACL|nr:hypothetical protein [Paenibacillus polysaccharolyticus]SCX81670.1 hypothetical protein SAMN05720606_101114 [Paenibacillus polysaccharolyticus]
MGWVEIVTAIMDAYKEREKSQNDKEAINSIIRAIYDAAQQVTNDITAKLEQMRLQRIEGIYLGLFLNLKDYKPDSEHKNLLEKIIYDANMAIGEIRVVFESATEFPILRDALDLLTILTFLRATAMSEAKFTFNDNHDDMVREMFTYVLDGTNRVLSIQEEKCRKSFENWDYCEKNAIIVPGGPLCFPFPDPPELPQYPLPGCSPCGEQRIEMKRDRVVRDQIINQKKHVEEGLAKVPISNMKKV